MSRSKPIAPEGPAALPCRPSSDEPRVLTLMDWLLIITGLAVAWSLPSPFSLAFPSAALAVALFALRVLLCPAFLVTVAAMGRQVRYRRRLRPAEWLSVILVAMQLALIVPNLDTVITRLHPWIVADGPIDWTLSRWSAAGSCLVLLTVGAGAGWYGCRGRWQWAGSLLALSGLALLFWGPLDAIARERPWPLPLQYGSPPTSGEIFHLAVRTQFWLLPVGLVFGVPAVAVLRSWRRREWIWTEWVSTVLASLLLALLILQHLSGKQHLSRPEIVAAAVAEAIWLGLVLIVSWRVSAISSC